MEQSEYQKKFSERPLAVGSVRAFRSFYVTSDCALIGQWAGVWHDGVNIAECRPKSGYVALWNEDPEPCDGSDLTACSCGFYGVWSTELITPPRTALPPVVGVTEFFGETLMGSLGVRARRAKILALAFMRADYGQMAFQAPMRSHPMNINYLGISSTYPSAEIFVGMSGLMEMRKKYDVKAPEE